MKVPSREIKNRVTRFQALLRENSVDLALLRQNADLYYFTGTVQDAHLAIPAEGDPLFLVWRVYERAKAESPLEFIEPLGGLSRLPHLLGRHGLLDCRRIGMELDVLPAALYLHYVSEVWPHAEVINATPLVRRVRSVKSSWEIERIRRACRQVESVISAVPELLKSGMNELDLAAELGAAFRRLGHPGYLRIRGWNQEIGLGQILSGPEGAVPSWVNTPGGGRGVNPAFGQSAAGGRIRPHEPLSIDLGGSVDGYQCDQTRLFCIGGLPSNLMRAYEAVLDFHRDFAARLVPGAVCGQLYRHAVDAFEHLGYGARFMGFKSAQVKFIGHGVGIEIDEYPFLSSGNAMRLAPGMVVAVEPKLVFEREGMVGIEDTYLITEKEAERLTLSSQELVVC